MKPTRDDLRATGIFDQVPEDELEDAVVRSEVGLLVVSAGRRFLSQGDRYDRLHMLVGGRCRAEMIDLSGKALRIDDLQAVESIGIGLLFGRERRLPVSVSATTDARLVTVGRRYLWHLLTGRPEVLEPFLASLSDKLVFLTERLRFLSLHTIREKIACYLLTLPRAGMPGGTRGETTIETRGEEPDMVVLPVGMEELSRYFGVARPSLSQAFSDLVRNGTIEKQGRRIRIVRSADLQRIREKERE